MLGEVNFSFTLTRVKISFPIHCIKFLWHIEEPPLKRIEQLAIS